MNSVVFVGLGADLALYCLKQVDQPKPGLVGGVCIALCCHHQCTWQHYVGKSFFKVSRFKM